MAEAGLTFISRVVEACETASENIENSEEFKGQWIRLRECLSRASSGAEHASYRKSLDAARKLAGETEAFLAQFKKKSFFSKAWSSKSNKKKLGDLASRLNVLIQEMQLGVAIDTRADVAGLMAKLDLSQDAAKIE